MVTGDGVRTQGHFAGTVELATPDDLPSLLALRREQGWQPSAQMMRALLDWESARVFVVRDQHTRHPIAVTSATAPGVNGVIGNVITAEAYRRRGLGRLLLRAALDWMRERDVRTALLDATESGRPLYRSLGFQPVADSYLWAAQLASIHTDHLHMLGTGYSATLATAETWRDDLAQIQALDASAFGGDRMRLLALLLAQPNTWLYTLQRQGVSAGYLVVRYPQEVDGDIRIGPWVATEPMAAAALLDAALAPTAPFRRALGTGSTASGHSGSIHMPMPGTNAAAISLLTQIGTPPQRDDLIMQLDLRQTDQIAADTPAQLLPHPNAAMSEYVYGWLSNTLF